MYVILVIITLAFLLIASIHDNKAKAYRINLRLTIVICAILVAMAALRAPSVGTDTASYIFDYRTMDYYTFSGLSERYEDYLGFYYLCKCFSLVSAPLWLWFGFVELVYLVAIYLFIKRFSQNPLLSILMFITTGLFLFSMAGMKQVLAMGVMIYSYLFFIDKKYKLSVLLCIYAYTCHPTSLVMIAAFILHAIRKSRYFNLIIVIAVLMTVFSGEWLLTSMVSTLGNEHFEAYLKFDSTYTASTLIYYLVLLGISLFGFNHFKQEDPSLAKITIGCSVVACCFHALSLVSANAFRLAFIFTPFLLILLPDSLSSIKKQSFRKNLSFLAIICLILFFFYSNRNEIYKFA